MMVTVSMRSLATGEIRVEAPDFPGCALTDADADSAIARLRLLVEGALADGFLAGRAAPDLRPPGHWQREITNPGTHWTQVHINVSHIEAIARHQRGR